MMSTMTPVESDVLAALRSFLLFVLPPSRDEQERRLRGRGDPNDKVLARLKKAEIEEPIGRALADHVVVNDGGPDDLGRHVAALAGLRLA